MALNLMDGNGQPALLYIVPCTLGMGSYCDYSFCDCSYIRMYCWLCAWWFYILGEDREQ